MVGNSETNDIAPAVARGMTAVRVAIEEPRHIQLGALRLYDARSGDEWPIPSAHGLTHLAGAGCSSYIEASQPLRVKHCLNQQTVPEKDPAG